MTNVGRERAPRTPPGERREQILLTSRALALERGLSAITLRAVGAKLGVAAGLIAHYIDGMDGLVARTFADIAEEERNDLFAAVAANAIHATDLQSLGYVVTTLLDGTRDNVTRVWVEAWTLGRDNEELAAATRAQMDGWQAQIQGLIASAGTHGLVHDIDPGETAWQILGMIDGLNAQSLVRWGAGSDRSTIMLKALVGMLGVDLQALG
jgi:AcrR family transcriptional regulator